MTVQIRATSTDDPSLSNDKVNIDIHFESTVLAQCYESRIVSTQQQTVDTVIIPLDGEYPNEVEYEVTGVTDTGSENLSTIAGFANQSCGALTFTQVNQ